MPSRLLLAKPDVHGVFARQSRPPPRLTQRLRRSLPLPQDLCAALLPAAAGASNSFLVCSASSSNSLAACLKIARTRSRRPKEADISAISRNQNPPPYVGG